MPGGHRIGVSHEHLFKDRLDKIQAVIKRVCRRHHASDDEEDEFRSLAYIKLIEDDYRVLREYKGRSTIEGYLNVVLEREFLDFRIDKWGKFRPSREAERMGPVAVLLEKLLVRERLTFDEACEVLKTNHKVTETREALWEMYGRLPVRLDRRPESEQVLAYVRDSGPLPDEAYEESQYDKQRARAYDALARGIQTLEMDDQLIVQLMFYDGWKQVEIARFLRENEKRFYRRVEAILEKLKRFLQLEGVDPRVLGIE
jgi:RNA polymerase sigma factor for flagellar operon FliA